MLTIPPCKLAQFCVQRNRRTGAERLVHLGGLEATGVVCLGRPSVLARDPLLRRENGRMWAC